MTGILTPNTISVMIVLFWAMLLVWLGYMWFKRWLRPRIKCTFIFPDRRQRSAFIRPNEQGLLPFKEGLFIFNPELILFSGAFFGLEVVPSLTFHYEHPSPVDLWQLQPAKVVTSTMLASAWSDKSLSDFVRAQEGGTLTKTPIRIGMLLVLAAAFVGIYLLFGTDVFSGLTTPK